MTGYPDIAVIIACYNAADTIERAVCSALAQDQVREVVIIDDASTDDTVVRVQDILTKDVRLSFERLSENKGPAHARNIGIQKTAAPWIAVLDADDVFLPGRFDAFEPYLKDFDFLADDLEIHQGKAVDHLFGGRVLDVTPVHLDAYLAQNFPDPKHPRKELSFIKPLMRRTFLEKYALSYNEKLRLGEDHEFYTRCLIHGARMGVIPQAGYVYNVRKSSLSGAHSMNDLESLWEEMEKLRRQAEISATENKLFRKLNQTLECRYQWRKLIDAVKGKNISEATKCFCRPPPVPFYLACQLASEASKRFLRRA